MHQSFNNFPALESNEIGLYWLQSNLNALLRMGLHTLRKVSFAEDLFVGVEKGIKIDVLIIWRIFVRMLLGPVLLLLFNVLTMSHISSGRVGFIKKWFLIGAFRYCT